MTHSNADTKGLVIVFTGDGKGKTTAAIGMGLRAAGHGIPVLCVQFVKGRWKTGESRALAACVPLFELVTMGRGFVGRADSGVTPEEHLSAAQGALARAREAISGARYGMVILDEVLYALQRGLVDVAAVLALIREKPAGLHLVLTGRNAPREIIEIADLVTEMHAVKHPYRQGVRAQPGVEY
ncbi:MAG: cob(I)yrinic acid a,c-diamide adenosyltransferase [Chloroflexi bacterium]|nr:cob(I)yrinic acid a,c-diamide adenosyltransferase [Chloroflexota bacterium]